MRSSSNGVRRESAIKEGLQSKRDSSNTLLHWPSPGGGGAPRTPEGRFRGFAAGGLVIMDEKRRRTLQDEKVAEAITRRTITSPKTVNLFQTRTVAGYKGHSWTEPLPVITMQSLPTWTTSATRTNDNRRIAGMRSFSRLRETPLAPSDL